MEAQDNPLKGVITHLAIIMDGNGRWAQQHGYSRSEGHRAGAKTVKRVIGLAGKYGIKYLTLYAFSTENWKRPKKEVVALMNLLGEFLNANLKLLMKNGIRLRTIGRIGDLPLIPKKALVNVIQKTEKNTNGQIVLALSYGGRAEIIDATKKIVTDVLDKKLNPNTIDEKTFSSYLYAPDIPDPDLLIRTSGEYRLSNFLLWQASYAELWITDTFWPDFGENDLIKAIEIYQKRTRRFGEV